MISERKRLIIFLILLLVACAECKKGSSSALLELAFDLAEKVFDYFWDRF